MNNVKKVLSEPTVYRACVGLTFPTDPEIHARLVAGEDIPWEERKLTRVEPGELTSEIPASSIPWLLDQGLIEVYADEVDDG